MKIIHTGPRYNYGERAGSTGRSVGDRWQACAGSGAIGPERIFQWQAINDLPAEAEVVSRGAVYDCIEPYRVRLVPASPWWPE